MRNPDPKTAARRLRTALARAGFDVAHGQALDLVAAQHGLRDWNTLAAALAEAEATPVTIPILRVFPGGEAERFYRDHLGFAVDWEHRFEPGLPLYRQVSLGECVLHLSEHHGDATPGSAVRIAVDDVVGLQRRLHDDPTYPLRIGIEEQDWGLDLTVPDPFGNRLIFTQAREVAG